MTDIAHRVDRYKDRVSTAFYENAPEVEWIISVTFDLAVVVGLDDEAVVAKARDKLREFTYPVVGAA